MSPATAVRPNPSPPRPRVARAVPGRPALLAALALLAAASPAFAQWTRVAALPVANMISVRSQGDTLLASADTTVFVSTDAGTTWRPVRRVAAGVRLVNTVLLDRGRLYAGTAGQGVFVSDDLGSTWQAFNAGLTGGFLDSQLDLSGIVVRGDSLYAATLGAGMYVHGLAAGATWAPFGDAFEPNQAANVIALASDGTRVVAGAGGNGSVFHRNPGEPEWTISWLDNVGLHPGVQAQSVTWTGGGWIVSTIAGLFHSTAGEEPWTRVDLGLGALANGAIATGGGALFGAFDIVNAAVIARSDDDGLSWQGVDVLPGAFVYSLTRIGDVLFAGRNDGLWRRPLSTASVADRVPRAPRLRLAGPQPAGDVLRFVVEQPEAGAATLELFDVAGRHAPGAIGGSWPAGTHEIALDARDLPPGVYEARLRAGSTGAVVRVVHVR